MKLSIRGILFSSVTGSVIICVLIAGLYLSSALKKNLNNKAEEELKNQNLTIAFILEQILENVDIKDTQPMVYQLGQTSGLRITITLKDGTVVADSDVPSEKISSVPNHANRPEIKEALKKGTGSSSRYSTTVGYQMIYSAKKFCIEENCGVIRVSRPLKEIDEATRALNRILLVTGIIVLIFSLIFAAIFASYFSKILRSMILYAKNLAKGKNLDSTPITDGELGGLTNSLKALSQKLEDSMEQLARERDRFEAVLEGMSEAVIALDDKKQISMINSAALILLELNRKPIGETLVEASRLPALTKLLDSLNSTDNVSLEFEINLSQKKIVLARATKQSSRMYIIVLMDVTKLRKLERIRKDFVANVSHELRTPISIILANSETLLEADSITLQMQQKFLSAIMNNSKRLNSLVNDLLDLARIEDERVDFNYTELNLKDLFSKMAEGLETRLKKKNQKLIIEAEPSLNLFLDTSALEQILYNFLDNALKYSFEGAQIILRAFSNEQNITIEVEDNGPGIQKEHNSRIFERFYRVDKGRSRELGGTGLGLAIAKNLTVSLGGIIGMKQAPQQGSIFYISFPVTKIIE